MCQSAGPARKHAERNHHAQRSPRPATSPVWESSSGAVLIVVVALSMFSGRACALAYQFFNCLCLHRKDELPLAYQALTTLRGPLTTADIAWWSQDRYVQRVTACDALVAKQRLREHASQNCSWVLGPAGPKS